MATSGLKSFTDIVDVNTISLQITGAVAGLLSIPETIAKFTEPAGECHRVAQMLEVIDDIKLRYAATRTSNNGAISISLSPRRGEIRDESHVAMENVDIRTPDGSRTLCKQLSFTVKLGQNLLITGNLVFPELPIALTHLHI
jgi:ABC-type uncharacterized transport system fused permease/ATPase subunit